MRKPTVDGPVYMEFKSYKSKNPPTSRLKLKAPPTALLSSGENLSSRTAERSTPRFKELQKELKKVKDKQLHLTRSIKKLECENVTLRTHIDSLIPAETHQQLKCQLDQTHQRCETLEQEIDQLVVVNDTHNATVDRLNDQITKLKETQDDLRKQLQLQQDLKQQQHKAYQRLERDTELLNETVQHLTTENETLKRDNHLLTSQTENLQAQIAEMERKVNLVDSVQKKLKAYETEAQRRARENKTLCDKNESCTRFVQILENDMQSVKKQNSSISEQNKQLHKQLSGMKKNLEHLRQKYDEVNKENRILKEKETRYLLHERFNVGKYANKLPTCVTELYKDEPTDLQPNANSNGRNLQMRNYMRAAKNVKKKHSEQFDQRYYLLHRSENGLIHRQETFGHGRTDATEVNKTTKK